MRKQAFIQPKLALRYDQIVVAMVAICVWLSPTAPRSSCDAQDIPAVTSMQRFIVPASPPSQRMPRVSDSVSPGLTAEAKPPAASAVRLPAVGTLTPSPRPVMLPKRHASSPVATVRSQPTAQLHLPIPPTSPDRLPAAGAAVDAVSPAFLPWQPPGITVPGSDVPAGVPGPIDEDEPTLLLAPPFGASLPTIGLPPIGRV
ncbi:MAG: hypothetical protein ACO1RT_17390, partial [Planctomycetaceae bacterium]